MFRIILVTKMGKIETEILCVGEAPKEFREQGRKDRKKKRKAREREKKRKQKKRKARRGKERVGGMGPWTRRYPEPW